MSAYYVEYLFKTFKILKRLKFHINWYEYLEYVELRYDIQKLRYNQLTSLEIGCKWIMWIDCKLTWLSGKNKIFNLISSFQNPFVDSPLVEML